MGGVSKGRRRWSACALLAAAALLGGCGGDDKEAATAPKKAATDKPTVRFGPRPVESAQQAANRIARAVRNRDCSAPRKLFVFDEVTPALCRKLLPDIEPAAPPNAKAYGSGAILRQADGGRAILALDSDRRYKAVTSFGYPDIPVLPVREADESMSFVVGAIRRDSCDEIVRLSLTFSNGASGKKFCALKPVRQLHSALNREYTATPRALGGDGSFVFYGLSAKPHYYTLVFIADKRGTYVFVTSVQA